MNDHEREQLRAKVSRQLGLAGAEKVHLVVLPTVKGGMEPMTRARKDALAASIEVALYARRDRTKVAEHPSPLDEESLLAVCRTCRGSCCRWGEDHANLTADVLRRVRTEARLADEKSLVDAYIELVPRVVQAGSCIYHGAEGCALPRRMRSEVCNRYLCAPLKELGREAPMPGYAQIAVSLDPDEGDRSLLLHEGVALDPKKFPGKS